jgi:hypothetical protein
MMTVMINNDDDDDGDGYEVDGVMVVKGGVERLMIYMMGGVSHI